MDPEIAPDNGAVGDLTILCAVDSDADHLCRRNNSLLTNRGGQACGKANTEQQIQMAA